MAARAAGLNDALVRERPHTELGWAAARPAQAALASARGQVMPSLERALAAYVHERPWARGLDALELSAQSAAD
jgi:dTDP-4-dehydrorhamnose reductase